MQVDLSVLVVGAGPTGLLLAAELARRGVPARVIDANPAPLHWDRATVVHPRTIEVFESLGIHEPLLAAGVKQRTARIHADGAVLGQIDLALCGSRYTYNINLSEEITESILTDHLIRHGGHVVRSSRLVAIEDRADHLLATIDHDGAPEKLSARWVVGCDGIHSITRTIANIDLIGHDIPDPWAVFDATIPGWPDVYEANYAYLDEIPVILTALPKKRWRVYLRPTSPDSDLLADAANTLRRYVPNARFENVDHPARFHCHTRVARHYRAGRILLAGDAAHVCTPAQGHGMNSGIQDAFNLAWKLALVCQGHCSPALLDSYEAERKPVAEMITASGDAAEHDETLATAAERRARDKAIRAAFANPKSAHHEAVAEAELNIDYCCSPIVMGDKHEALKPGHRLPNNIELHHPDGRKRPLHELTHHPGHTALLVSANPAAVAELEQIERQLHARPTNPITQATTTLTTHPDHHPTRARLTQNDAKTLDITKVTLLLIRPDGHIGLRADQNHARALGDYEALLKSSLKNSLDTADSIAAEGESGRTG